MMHYVAYHSSRIMGRPYAPGIDFEFLSKKPEGILRRAIGAWAWVIVGERERSRTRYQLVGVYSPTHVSTDADGSVIAGPGQPFEPPLELNDLGWFKDLLDEQGNFGFGFNAIARENVVRELEALLAAVPHPSAGEDPAIFFSREVSGAHDRLQSWRRRHGDGFVLNCVRATAGLLHRVDCPHLGDATEGGHDLARQRKVCSLSLYSLRTWAGAHGLSELKVCSDCRPIEDQQVIVESAETFIEQAFVAPANAGDARRRVFSSIVQRQGQPAFRNALIGAYSSRCAITACGAEAVLEAAHIIPYQGLWTNHPRNGLLLRADVHTLFDLGLLAVHAETMTVLVSPKLAESPYAPLSGSKLIQPADPRLGPEVWALEEHRRRSGLQYTQDRLV